MRTTSEMACNVVDNCMLRELQLEEKDIPGAKLVKDPSECNLEELKQWLECRGQKTSGKKGELVERVLGCLRLNTPLDPKVFNGVQRFQLSRIFRGCPETTHHVPKSRNTINLFRNQTFSSTFEENPKFLFFHSPKNLFFHKLTSYSTASSTVIKYLKSRRWCLFKNTSSSVHLYLKNLIPSL